MVTNNFSDKHCSYLSNNYHAFSYPNIYVFFILQLGILAFFSSITLCIIYHFMENSYQQNMLKHDDQHHIEYYRQGCGVCRLLVNLYANFMDVCFDMLIVMHVSFITSFVIFFLLFLYKT